VVAPEADQEVVGIRPGEKLHEQMIGAEDSYFTYEYPEHFKILPNINNWGTSKERIKDGKLVPDGFVYASDSNTEWTTDEELQDWINRNYSEIGKF
jgi:FlaA1/EpsC-like NDP-sugar epimerase